MSRKLPPEPLSEAEVAALLGATGRSPSGIRNWALVWTLYRTGLRLAEALALLPRDITADGLRVRHGKGDKARTVPLPDEARHALEHWMVVRERYASGRQPVFCLITKGKEGLPVDQAYVRAMLRRLGDKAGLDKRVHAHGLRHSYAVRLARREGVKLMHVQIALGHSNVATTAKYLRTLGADELLEELRRLDP